MSKKVVVQMSGGIESTTMLALAINEHGKENVFPIGFNDDSAEWKYKNKSAVNTILTHFQMHRNYFECAAPPFEKMAYKKDDDYDDCGFIPGFKMIINTISLSWAQTVGATEVWIGNMIDNVYSDETPQSLDNTQNTFNAMYGDVSDTIKNDHVFFVQPFENMTKGQVIDIASANMPQDILAATVSCGDDAIYGGYNCGECSWCFARKQGFENSRIEDPTKYLLNSKLASQMGGME